MQLFNKYHVAIALFAAFLTAMAIALPADARDNRNANPHEAPGTWQTTTTYYDESPTIIPGRNQLVIEQGDRTVIRNYMGRHYTVNCPAGMTISPNGCVPISKVNQTVRTTTTTYTVGQPLAETVIYTYPPEPLVQQLRPVPTGYEYVVVDGDVVLLAPNRQVIDAVTWAPYP